MAKLKLSASRKRSLAASLIIIEKLVDELEMESVVGSKRSMKSIQIEKDWDMDAAQKRLNDIREKIAFLADKYEIKPSIFSWQQLLQSRKSKMWEVLSNSKSERLKGFGEFKASDAHEYDRDIESLLKLCEAL
jgi:hypothetical protein